MHRIRKMKAASRSRRAALAAVLALTATSLLPSGAAGPFAQASRASSPEDRYAMAGGCYAMRATGSGLYVRRAAGGFAATAADESAAEPFHFQATDLGSYLLYASGEDFFAASAGAIGDAAHAATSSTPGGIAEGLSGGASTAAAVALASSPAGAAAGRGAAIVAAKDPSDLADWTIEESGVDEFSLALASEGSSLAVAADGTLSLAPNASPFAFRLTTGCAAYPEVEVNVTGDAPKGASSFAEVEGYLDAHVHMMAYEFLGGRARCGRPWHRYGVKYALVDCPDHEPGGRGAVLEMVLSSSSVPAHDTAGWPTFPYWPRYNSLTHEQLYYKWLERAWRGGLRLFVNLLVDNHALCAIYPYRKNSCNEMDGVRLQAQRIRELERYIDAQSGGPGEGWFRIVTDPFQARRVINDGKLAVVLGMEVSTPFDCGLIRDVPTCNETQIDQRLSALYDLGVRQMEMVNKFDNALSGVKGDAGTTGIVVNNGNAMETGSYWQMKTCDDVHSDAHDNRQMNFHDDSGSPEPLTGRDSIFGAVMQVAGPTGASPLYPPGPHCNVRGLTSLGVHLIQQLMSKGMIFDPDHMSALARKQAVDVIEQAGYSGIVSSHSWADDTIYERVLELGGVVTPYAGSSSSFVAKWRQYKPWADQRFGFGLGYGSDVNGFGSQGGPRGGNAVTYPFAGFGGVTVDRQRSGQRLYDVNSDGVAHYGMYPDWLQDIRRVADDVAAVQGGEGGDALMKDMARGPEAYLQMWERAIGVGPNACRSDVPDMTDATFALAQPGMTAEEVVRAAGQPNARTATALEYCMTAGRTGRVVFSDDVVSSTEIV